MVTLARSRNEMQTVNLSGRLNAGNTVQVPLRRDIRNNYRLVRPQEAICQPVTKCQHRMRISSILIPFSTSVSFTQIAIQLPNRESVWMELKNVKKPSLEEKQTKQYLEK